MQKVLIIVSLIVSLCIITPNSFAETITRNRIKQELPFSIGVTPFTVIIAGLELLPHTGVLALGLVSFGATHLLPVSIDIVNSNAFDSNQSSEAKYVRMNLETLEKLRNESLEYLADEEKKTHLSITLEDGIARFREVYASINGVEAANKISDDEFVDAIATMEILIE